MAAMRGLGSVVGENRDYEKKRGIVSGDQMISVAVELAAMEAVAQIATHCIRNGMVGE